MEENALEIFITELLPLVRVVTPNIPEAEALTGLNITSEVEMVEAAKLIRGVGARAVLIKGGHLEGQKAGDSSQNAENEEAIDLLDDDGVVTVFRAKFIRGANLRGSGCILSAAIAAGLGKGMSLQDSVREAKDFLLNELRRGFAT
jgi:hydroxymethylpyrimidine/phosphomethylpyrimidine kinase